MIIDEPGYRPTPTKPRPAAPKPKPKPKPVYRPPARPASRPPGVASPYRPKPRTTTPLRPANFSTITASARSRVGNIYAPGGPSTPYSYAKPQTAAPQVYGPTAPRRQGPTEADWKRDPVAALNILAASTMPAWATPSVAPMLPSIVNAFGAAAQAQSTGKPKAGGGRGGYAPRAYYGGGGGYSGGGGGGGGGGSEFERYGISKDWMQAYKAFWGHAMPSEAWGMFSPVQELFSRYQSRLPQLDDWQRIWQAAKDYMVGAGKDAKNMPKNLALYEPWIAQGVRPPLFTPPTTSYAPFLSF